MKTKYLDKRQWRRLLAKDYKEVRLHGKPFDGIVGLLTMKKVKAPLKVTILNETVTVADVGYEWLQILPNKKHYSITVMYNDHGEILQYYIDVNEENILQLGHARTDDLFLDILVLPDGRYELVDEDDLKRAYKENKITKRQYDFAYSTAHNVMHRVRDHFDLIQQEVEYCRTKILEQ